MNPYKAVSAYLQSRSVAVEGTNLFVGHVPPSPDSLLCVIPTPGIYDPTNILQPYNKGTFQLFARGTFDEAYTLLENAYDVLQGLGGVTLSTLYFVEIVALQDEVTELGKDSLNRFQLVQNYRFEYWKQTENRQ